MVSDGLLYAKTICIAHSSREPSMSKVKLCMTVLWIQMIIAYAQEEECRNSSPFDSRPNFTAVNETGFLSKANNASGVICERQNGGSSLETETRGRGCVVRVKASGRRRQTTKQECCLECCLVGWGSILFLSKAYRRMEESYHRLPHILSLCTILCIFRCPSVYSLRQ